MENRLDILDTRQLGRLFPIILQVWDPRWPQLYALEKEAIEKVFTQGDILRINHIGSSAVPGIPVAKPTIDILVEVRGDLGNATLIDNLLHLGYLFSPQPDSPAPHMLFMKGYTPSGFAGQAFHAHVRYKGDWDELYFRDRLIAHPAVARSYGELKLSLKASFEHDREAYTRGKTDFIRAQVFLARTEFGGRYV